MFLPTPTKVDAIDDDDEFEEFVAETWDEKKDGVDETLWVRKGKRFVESITWGMRSDDN